MVAFRPSRALDKRNRSGEWNTHGRSWEPEAEVYVPNATIKALGLPVQKEVLDCQLSLLRLDGQLNMVAYGHRELVNQTGD